MIYSVYLLCFLQNVMRSWEVLEMAIICAQQTLSYSFHDLECSWQCHMCHWPKDGALPELFMMSQYLAQCKVCVTQNF